MKTINNITKVLFVCIFSMSSLVLATEWYEEGTLGVEGGWVNVNDSGISPAHYGQFQNTGSVTSVLLDGDTVVGDEGDFVGAFSDTELRGIAFPTQIPVPTSPYFGENAFMVYMYSNDSGTETYTFKFYDSSSGLTYDLPESVVFVADMTEGTLMSPYAFTVTLDAAGPCDDDDADGVCDDEIKLVREEYDFS